MDTNFDLSRILIVDDDLDAVKQCQAAFRIHFKHAVEILTASNATDGLALLEQQDIHLVITDLDMNNINGFHLLKSIKANDPMVQIIITTGHESQNAIQSALRLGVDDYFLKPYEPSRLIAAVVYLREKQRRWKHDGLCLATCNRG